MAPIDVVIAYFRAFLNRAKYLSRGVVPAVETSYLVLLFSSTVIRVRIENLLPKIAVKFRFLRYYVIPHFRKLRHSIL